MTNVRFLDAAAGAAPGRLEVRTPLTTAVAGGQSDFGEVTPYAATPSGGVQLQFVSAHGRASASARLTPGGRYTVVAVRANGHTSLHVYRDGPASAGTAKLRVIHAAPELGQPDVTLGGRPIAQGVAFGASTGYISVSPTGGQLTVTAPNGSRTLASANVALAAGTSTTAVIVGTAGQPVRIVSTQDETVTPGGPPETGLGGLTVGGGPRWLLILAAMAAGGILAGGLYTAARRR